MTNRKFPFAVRLIGFSEQEAGKFDAVFSGIHGKGYAYSRLTEGNLQDPDLYVANGSEPKALVALAAVGPSSVRPALLIGKPRIDLAYPCVERPVQWEKFYDVLDDLVEKRADALSRLQASDVVVVPERRRRPRVETDQSNPEVYARMRAQLPPEGGVLVVDKSAALRDYLTELLARNNVNVSLVADESEATEFCRRQKVAVVLINTSTPGVDPYRLCWTIKEKEEPVKPSVIFLLSHPSFYDVSQARYVGVDGFLTKPLAAQHLISVLKKFMPFLR